jgi:ubiquinone/menaquinone biosynthesis C-methylase UbiE
MEVFMDILNERLKYYSAGKVLDIGTGRGNFIPVISECFNSFSEIIGIDTNDKALSAARESFNDERIKFVNMDAANMKFDDGSLDTVCISNTLHHIPDMHKVLNEMMRVLKPGGLFIVSEMFCDNQSEKQLSHVYVHHFNAKIDTLLGICHNKTFKRQEIIDIVDNLGLDIIDTFDYNTAAEQAVEDDSEEEKKFLDDLFESMEKRLEVVKEFNEYESLMAELNGIKSVVYKTGFWGATELMVIGRKK